MGGTQLEGFQSDGWQQGRDNRNEQGKHQGANQHDLDSPAVPDIAHGANECFEHALGGGSRSLAGIMPADNGGEDQQQADGIDREDRIRADQGEQQAAQSWPDDPGNIHLHPTQGDS